MTPRPGRPLVISDSECLVLTLAVVTVAGMITTGRSSR